MWSKPIITVAAEVGIQNFSPWIVVWDVFHSCIITYVFGLRLPKGEWLAMVGKAFFLYTGPFTAQQWTVQCCTGQWCIALAKTTVHSPGPVFTGGNPESPGVPRCLSQKQSQTQEKAAQKPLCTGRWQRWKHWWWWRRSVKLTTFFL